MAGSPNEILDVVVGAAEVLARAGEAHQGLFPSLLDLDSHTMLDQLPDPIPGQRQGDRSHRGSNLIHDEAALLTMYALAEATGRPALAAAADRYLERFATHCTGTATGLFPWGEHAYWHLSADGVGNSGRISRPDATGGATHDHLRQAPLWLWEKLDGFAPACVQSFAAGLDFHWVAGEPLEYIRHAPIEQRTHPSRAARSCDFPRHGGFYILDWAFAHSRSGESRHLEQMGRMLDYWWTRRDADDLLLIESRSPAEDERFYQINAPGQTLSLGASLLEAASVLEVGAGAAGSDPGELAAIMRQRAEAYLNGFLAAPHDLANGVFVILSRRGSGEVTQAMPIWGSVYGVWPASYVALTALCAHRLTGRGDLLAWAAAVGERYAAEALPEDVAVPAMDVGLGLGLLADLYDITAAPHWLSAGLALADQAMDRFFDRGALPRGAVGIDWYESQMGPAFCCTA